MCSLVSVFETSRGENCKLLAFFAQRSCSIMCSLVPRFESSSLKGRESQAACILRATVVFHQVLPGLQVRDLKGREYRNLLAFFAQRWCSIMCSLVPSFETHSRMCVDFCTLGGWFSNGDLPSKSGALFWAAAAYRLAPAMIRLPNGHAEVCFGLSSSTLSSVPIVFHCFIPHKFVRLERMIWWASAALCE